MHVLSTLVHTTARYIVCAKCVLNFYPQQALWTMEFWGFDVIIICIVVYTSLILSTHHKVSCNHSNTKSNARLTIQQAHPNCPPATLAACTEPEGQMYRIFLVSGNRKTTCSDNPSQNIRSQKQSFEVRASINYIKFVHTHTHTHPTMTEWDTQCCP